MNHSASLLPTFKTNFPGTSYVFLLGKFLPFKTPLSAKYNDQIPEECRFDLEMLFATLKSKKVSYVSSGKEI